MVVVMQYTALPDNEHFALTAALVWPLGNGESVTIPAGYRFNVSAPRRLRPVVSRWRRLHLASCVHDYLLMTLHWSRPKAGRQFYRALREAGVWWIAAAPLGLFISFWKSWEAAPAD